MLIQDIKKLPKEFDFRSNINSLGIVYHTREEEHHFVITWNVDGRNAKATFPKEEFRKRLFKKTEREFSVTCFRDESGTDYPG